uniref:Uncharacterized protein n=1 Tax=Timema poppense TaxID=170557 RepID=A0A7R9DRQ3_TIMPO|nr:unnamed protein product [Timema poppensis]
MTSALANYATEADNDTGPVQVGISFAIIQLTNIDDLSDVSITCGRYTPSTLLTWHGYTMVWILLQSHSIINQATITSSALNDNNQSLRVSLSNNNNGNNLLSLDSK